MSSLMPKAGHMDHMAAHIFMRMGRYHDASEVNLHATEVDRQYLATSKALGEYASVYCPHNIRFLWLSLSMEGRSRESIAAAQEVTHGGLTNVNRDAADRQVPAALYALCRFARWKEILSQEAPPSDLNYSTAIWHYARGLAFAHTGSSADAAHEYRQLLTVAARIPRTTTIGVNRASDQLYIANTVLGAEIALCDGEIDAAVGLFERAVAAQDKLKYDEPPPWYYPVRESLGAALLREDRAQEAEAVYREDLRRNPESGWSLSGLSKSLSAQKDGAIARATHVRFLSAWRYADFSLDSNDGGLVAYRSR